MALTKITPQMFDTSATTHDLNVDNGTFVVDGSASRVGIGTASPDEILHVKGDGARIYIDSTDYNLFSIGRRGSSGADLDKAYLRMKNAGTNTVVLDTAGDSYFNGGNVGIGTTSPATPLHITGITTFDGDGASRAEITSSTANSVVSLDVGGFNGTPSVARDIRFLTNAAANAKTERMRISSAGHLIPASDSTYNIGANATRFANGYFDTVHGNVGTFTAASAGAVALNIKRSGASGRAQFALQDESGNNLWRVGATGPGSTDFAFFDGSENVLTLSTNNSATFAGNIVNTGTIQATHNATISAQTNMQLALRDADSVNMRANFMVEDNLNNGRGGLAIQATEAGVTNDRDLYLQPAGGRVGVLTTTPQYGLDVNTTSRFVHNLTAEGNIIASDVIARTSGGLSLQTDEGTKRLFIKDNGDVKVGQLAVASATSAPLHVAKASTDVQAIFGDNNSSIDDPSIRIIGRNSANSDIRYTFAGLDADANKGFLGYNQGSGGFVNALEFNTSGNVTIANGVSSDTQSRMYVWTALNNSANSGDRFVKICRIVAGQSARVNIELVGRYASYGNGAFGAYGMLVGQCNNDSNFDFVFYDYRNGQTGGQVVMEAGQVNVSSATVDLYIKIHSFSEIVARAMMSEGTLTPETGNTGASVGSSSAPSGYINIPLQSVLIEEQNGHLRFTERSRRAELRSDGDFHVAWTGSSDTTGYFYAGEDFSATNHRINRAVTQGNTILVVSAYSSSSADSALFYGVSNGGSNTNAAAIRTGRNTSTSRSINSAGTINASGTDYAEYMKKKSTAFDIAAGDICGVNENGELTNKFTEAHSFVVKSTDPSYVGGDSWGSEDVIGPKPLLTKQNFADRNNEVPETDEEYTARKEKYESDLAAYEAKLNAERIKYDRIAFSGQVPVNITGAKVGDYIIPKEKTGDLITAEAITEPTFVQYQMAVGKVWKILEDGRAYISVKIG